MKKLAILLLAVMFFVPSMSSAASLTSAQIQSILSILSSFGADSATVANVQTVLTGSPVPTGVSATTGVPTTSNCSPTNDLAIGSTGADVTCLQQTLRSDGYLSTNATGYFGFLTKSAVIAWQKANGIPFTGKFDSTSRARWNPNVGSSVTTPTISTSTIATNTVTNPSYINRCNGSLYPSCIDDSHFVCPSSGSGYCAVKGYNQVSPPTPNPIPAPILVPTPVSVLTPTSTPPITSPTPPTTPAALCSGVVNDNFNSYSNGPIVGQGGWFNRANGTPWIVESTTTEEGSGALYNNNTGADSVVTKTGTNTLTDGTQCYWVYPLNPQGWGSYSLGENVQMGVYQGSWDGPTRTVMAFMKDGHVAYIDPRVDKYVESGTYNANAWNLAQIQWRSSDDTARFRVNDGVWTNWIPFVGAPSFTGFNTVGFVTFSLGTGGVYIDNLH